MLYLLFYSLLKLNGLLTFQEDFNEAFEEIASIIENYKEAVRWTMERFRWNSTATCSQRKQYPEAIEEVNETIFKYSLEYSYCTSFILLSMQNLHHLDCIHFSFGAQFKQIFTEYH